MKTELSKIAQDLEQGTITEEEGRNLLLNLLNVRQSLTMKVKDMKFIPENPYMSTIISWERGNVWELHELYPEDQNIEIKINTNCS